MRPIPRLLLCLAIFAIWQTPLLQAAKYYVVPLDAIGFTESSIDELNVSVTRIARTHDQVVRFPDIALNGENDQAYIAFPELEDDNQRWWGSENQSQLRVALKLAGEAPFSGKVSLASFGSPAKVAYDFEFDPSQLEESTEAEFEAVRRAHYARLAQSTIPGGDWFRYQAGDAYTTDERARRWRNLGRFDSSFNMFTGQRAVSENLALDRELILGTSTKAKPIKVETIQGVTVEAIDWSDRITDVPTAIDPLAMAIPHDQHAAFFNSIKDLNQVIRLAEEDAVGYFQTMSNRNVYQGLAKKYQKQMGILIPDMLAEQLPVKSVAITGGDPFLPSGSDLSVIFETEAPDALMAALNAMIQAQARINGGNLSTETSMNQDPTQYSYRTVDRSFSAHIFQGENFVAVSNSRHQIHRMTDTANGEVPSLGSTEEFKFFR